MSQVKINVTDEVMCISLNRPEVRNAFNPQMIEELTDAFYEASEDDGVRAIILKGEGKSFCAGADLSWMKSMVDFDYNENLSDSDKLYEMFHLAESCNKPIIGHIHGHAMGGALGLIAICDFAVAVEGTKFGFTEVKLGLVPAVISSFVTHKISNSWANKLMLSGEIFNCKEALNSGLLHFYGSASEVEEKISNYIESISLSSLEAIVETKKILRFNNCNNKQAIRKNSTDIIAKARVSKDGQERLKTFLSKSKK